MKNKTQLHKIFLCNLALLFVWCISIVMQEWALRLKSDLYMYFDYLAFTGVAFIPVTLLLSGIIFAHTGIKFSWRYLLLFVIPCISIIILWTNDFHQLFFINYSVNNSEIIFGEYFKVHTIYSYGCVLAGLFYFGYYSIRNTGLFSMQAFLIFLGFSIPLIVNIMFTLNILPLTNYATPIAFSLLVVCCLLATMKYDFLNIIPMAMRSIVDHISDSFIVLNLDMKVVDYNKTYFDNFGSLFKIEKNKNFIELLETIKSITIDRDLLIRNISDVIQNNKIITYDRHIVVDDFDKHFSIEMTPMLSKSRCIGVVILLKDVTHIMKHLEMVYQSQALLRKEKHDFANHLNTLIAMCMLKKPDTLNKIENYAMKLLSSSCTSYKSYNTGNNYIDSLLSVKNNMAHQKNIILDAGFDFPISDIDVDDVDLTSIVGNILDNAFDAVADSHLNGNCQKVVSIYSYSEDNKCYISISNNGPEIPGSNLEKIFENKFSTKVKKDGERGFGLYITKELVYKNNGKITVTSDKNGTEFLLEFCIKDHRNKFQQESVSNTYVC